jgi:RNA polymerase-binding transcription factor DksA
VSIRKASPPRKRLLVHLSQAVETLALRKEPSTHVAPLKGVLDGNVKLQSFEVSNREFGHFENISNALNRLDLGTYGRCMFCGRRIERDVLAQTPWATECLECGDHEPQP